MRDSIRPRRSALYLPASNAKALAKARNLPVDVVLLDLEDSVAPDAKETARVAAMAAVQEGGFGSREVVIRVNAIDTPWGTADLLAAAASGADGILVPKINGAAEIDRYDSYLGSAPAKTRLWAMIETCAAVGRLDAIAATTSRTRLDVFVLGTNDLAREMRARLLPGRVPFQPIFALAVAAARTHGLVVLDGVCNEYTRLDVFRAESEQGWLFGFDGKTLIHPNQVAICNEIFSPSQTELAWANTVVAAFDLPENAGKGVIPLDGKMVELLHLEEARRTRAMAAGIIAQQDPLGGEVYSASAR